MDELRTIDANDMLLDREIRDRDDVAVGKVDDIELADNDDQGPELTGFLCGPVALGPRIGGRAGVWWVAIGRRLRGTGDADPVRIPYDDVVSFDRTSLRLRRAAADYGTHVLRHWVDEYVVGRIPGGGRARR